MENNAAANRSRSWVFTLNNPADDVRPCLEDNMLYLVYQLEEGEQGTPHLQGFVYWANAVRMVTMRQFLPGAHVEVARGTPAQNKAYCTKDSGRLDGPWEFGDMPRQGKRRDWDRAYEVIDAAVRDGDTDADIIMQVLEQDHHFIEKMPAIVKYAQLLRKRHRRMPQRGPPVVRLYWGPTGSGKTRRCWDEAPLAYAKPAGKWFEGYCGQEEVILDEFPDESIPITLLLQMLDRYPLTVEVKGGSVGWTPSHIWISSNLPPESWYPEASQEHRDALMRRLTEFGVIEHMMGQAAPGPSVEGFRP